MNSRKCLKQETQRARWRRAIAAVCSASRKDSDVTQEIMAERMGWSRSTIAKFETGNRRINAEDLLLWASALELEPETLLRRIVRW